MENAFDQFDATPKQADNNPFNQFDKKASLFEVPSLKDAATFALNPALFLGTRPKEQQRAVLDQALQGATFGYADEIQDRIGAGIASGVTGEKYSDILDAGRKDTAARLENQTEQYPQTSLLANAGGGLLTGAATKLPAFLSSGNTATKVLKSAATGAAAGGLYGSGSATEGNRLQGAKEGAVLGATTGAAIPIIGNVASAGLQRLAKPGTIQATSDDIRGLASQQYKLASDNGGVLKPEFTDKFLDVIEQAKPKTELGQMLSKNDPLVKLADDIAGKRGKALTLDEAQEFDELLGDLIDSHTELGRVTKQGKKLLDIQTQFRQSIDAASDADIEGGKQGFEALKEGRKLWSKAARLRDIEKIISRAEMTENPSTAIKTGFRTLASNPNRLRGYSIEERKLIEKAAKSGVITDLARVAGSRLNPIIAGSTGGLGSAAAAQGLGMASRGAATKLQVNKADKVAAAIAGGLNKSKEPTALNKIAQSILQGIKPSVADINKMPPKQAKEVINLIKKTDGMNPEQLRLFIEQNVK